MSKIPTAEEFLNDIDEIARNYDRYEYGLPTGNYDLNLEMQSKIIEFAKLHVKAALKEASEKAELNYADGKYDCPAYCEEPFNMTCDDLGNCHYISRNSILNAYPLENIK